MARVPKLFKSRLETGNILKKFHIVKFLLYLTSLDSFHLYLLFPADESKGYPNRQEALDLEFDIGTQI